MKETIIFGFDVETDEDDAEYVVSVKITTGKIVDFEPNGRVWFQDDNGEKKPVIEIEKVILAFPHSFNFKDRGYIREEIKNTLKTKGLNIVNIEELKTRFL